MSLQTANSHRVIASLLTETIIDNHQLVLQTRSSYGLLRQAFQMLLSSREGESFTAQEHAEPGSKHADGVDYKKGRWAMDGPFCPCLAPPGRGCLPAFSSCAQALHVELRHRIGSIHVYSFAELSNNCLGRAGFPCFL